MQAGGLGAVLNAAGVFFVPVCSELGFSRSELSAYLTFYLVATIFAMPIVGKWIQKYNINKLLTIAILLVVIFEAAMAFYSEPWQWWVSGIVFGLAGSFIFVVPAPILISNWFCVHQGFALGIAMSFSSIGGAILSPVFTLLIQSCGWREAYVIAALIIAILVLPWTLFVFKLHPEDVELKPYGWNAGFEQERHSSVSNNEEPNNVCIYKFLKTGSFVCLFLFAGLIAFFSGFNSQLPGYAESIGYDALISSTLVTAIMVGSIAEKYLFGYLSDKIGIRFTMNIQLAMVCAGFVGFIVSKELLIVIYISAVFFGAQNSLVSVTIPLLVRQIFGNKNYPLIYPYTRIGTGLIGCLGPVGVAGIYDLAGSFIPAFVLGIGVTLAAFLCANGAYAMRGSHYLEA